MLPDSLALIGSDRFLTLDEVERAAAPHALTRAAWDIYTAHFQRFTGASLDPQFHRLRHPASRFGALHLATGTAVVVVGTGPSLAAGLTELLAIRDRVRIFTSPRGAEVLLGHGVVPDLVLVEHQTALDAHHSARHVRDAAQATLPRCPLVAAEWRTPAELLTGVAPGALFVPSPASSWGLWPATAAAMALDGGASRVSLLGIDLGTADRPDAAHAPLAALLQLLAWLSPVAVLDCGAGGAHKRGWQRSALAAAAGARLTGPCEVIVDEAPDPAERLAQACADLRALSPILEHARELLETAIAARTYPAGASVSRLGDAATGMLGWGRDVRTRILLQEGLGLAFLPRFWRSGIDLTLGTALWRPLLLATHELIGQAHALAGVVAQRKAA